MTDEQVKKGLEICSNEEYDCPECPYFSKIHTEPCYEELVKDALALINRLEEECADKERYTIELYNRARDAERELKDWKQNYEALDSFKRKLEDELIERGFAEYAHGDFRILSEEEKAQIRKETAKEILQSLYDGLNDGIKSNISDDITFACIRIRTAIILKAQQYGVEVGE